MKNKIDSRVVLVHHHIFKNAGTSFNYALEHSFGNEFAEYDLPDGQVVSRKALLAYVKRNPHITAISGHHIALPPIHTEHFKTISSVIIRDPLARVRSIYKFERKQNAQTEGAIMAKKLSFKNFVEWRLETTPKVFCNYQTYYCSRTEKLPVKYLSAQQDLEQAMLNLESCFAVGTVERYQDFLIMAQYEARKYFPNIFLLNCHLNATVKNTRLAHRSEPKAILIEEIGEELVRELERSNKLDMKLYEFANQKVDTWRKANLKEKAEYFNTFGESFCEHRNWQSAKAMFESASSLDRKWFKPYYGLAKALDKIGDSDGAIAHFRQVAEMKPDFAWSYFSLGNILYKQGAFDEALKQYRKATTVHPVKKSFFLYMCIGDTLIQLKEYENAIKAYRKAEDIDPSSLVIKAKLAYIHAISKQQQQFKEKISDAIQNTQDKCIAYITLGDIFSEGGLVETAIKFYTQGKKINPKSEICTEKIAKLMNKS